MALYDAYGRPIRTQELTREHAAPAMAGVRSIWTESVAFGLTPVRLASLLQNAADGDHRDYLTLAEEMEERDLHYSSVLRTRKLAVSRLPVVVEAATDATRDQEIADAVREMIRSAGFKGLLKDLLDSLGKSYSVCEILWDRSASRWRPTQYKWRDPRFFTFDRVTRSELRLLDDADMMNGVPLAPFKFIVHAPKLKTGIPVRGGLARLAAWAYMCKGYGMRDWMAFAEIFGMPFRMGRYGTGANDDDIAILKTAVANLGSDAAAVFPESMKIELVEASKAGGSQEFFQRLADWLDRQVSKGVLGQTMTTDDGSSRAQAQVHDEVRDDIRDDDAEQLEETINRDLVKPFVDLNFGPQQVYPYFRLHIAEPEDIQSLTNALKELVPLGLKVEQSVVRDKIGLPDPDPKAKPEDMLGAPAAPAPAVNRALNREQDDFTPEQQALEGLAEKVIDLARDAMAGNEDLIVEAIMASDSFDDAIVRLLELYPQMQVDELQDLLTRGLLGAEMFGRYTLGEETP